MIFKGLLRVYRVYHHKKFIPPRHNRFFQLSLLNRSYLSAGLWQLFRVENLEASLNKNFITNTESLVHKCYKKFWSSTFACIMTSDVREWYRFKTLKKITFNNFFSPTFLRPMFIPLPPPICATDSQDTFNVTHHEIDAKAHELYNWVSTWFPT